LRTAERGGSAILSIHLNVARFYIKNTVTWLYKAIVADQAALFSKLALPTSCSSPTERPLHFTFIHPYTLDRFSEATVQVVLPL